MEKVATGQTSGGGLVHLARGRRVELVVRPAVGSFGAVRTGRIAALWETDGEAWVKLVWGAGFELYRVEDIEHVHLLAEVGATAGRRTSRRRLAFYEQRRRQSVLDRFDATSR